MIPWLCRIFGHKYMTVYLNNRPYLSACKRCGQRL